MIRIPHDFKPLIDNLSAAARRPQTARRLIVFFAAAILAIARPSRFLSRALSGQFSFFN